MDRQSKGGEPADTKSEEAEDHLTSAEEIVGSVAHNVIPTRERPKDRRSGSNFIFRALLM